MTDKGREERSTESGDARQRWVEEVQEALDRTGDAIRTAWEATRDNRMGALESAKQAAQELGEVIDKGISAAKERWAASEQRAATTASDTEGATAATAEGPAGTPADDVTVTPVEDESAGQT